MWQTVQTFGLKKQLLMFFAKACRDPALPWNVQPRPDV